MGKVQQIDVNAYHKILIIQTAFAGDVVLATPFARGVKQIFPEAKVHFLVKPDTSDLLKNNPYIDTIYTYDKRGLERGAGALLKWIGKLRKEHFDAAFVPHRSLRSALLVWGAQIPRRVGFHRSAGSFLFTDVVPYLNEIHEVERNLRLLRIFSENEMNFQPELYPGPEEKKAVDAFLQEMKIKPDEKVLAIAPGSVWFTKRWPFQGFGETAGQVWRKRGIRSILIGGKEDHNLASQITGKRNPFIVNGMGRFSLLESAELIRRCCAILTNDSAPLHLAVAVGTPVVAIFGPTVPSFGFAPYGEKHQVVQKELDCRPCAIHGGQKCPEGHFRCMKDITSDEVVQMLERYFV